MIVQGFPRDYATNTPIPLLAPKDNTNAEIIPEFLIRKDEGSLIGHAKHAEDRQDRRKLDVFIVLFEARNSRRADFSERRELLLRQVQAVPSPDCFFDKKCPIEAKLPFHLRSIRSSKVLPS